MYVENETNLILFLKFSSLNIELVKQESRFFLNMYFRINRLKRSIELLLQFLSISNDEEEQY